MAKPRSRRGKAPAEQPYARLDRKDNVSSIQSLQEASRARTAHEAFAHNGFVYVAPKTFDYSSWTKA